MSRNDSQCKNHINWQKGQQKSREASIKRRKNNLAAYLTNPRLCLGCQKPLTYEKRVNKFCSHSCSASITNTQRPDKSINELILCRVCGTGSKHRKFCSDTCRDQLRIDKLNAGVYKTRPAIKAALIIKNGDGCSSCSSVYWQGKKLSLELDHIDGDASNNQLSNVQILCPNCHSVTDTWKGRNVGKGRKSRGLALS